MTIVAEILNAMSGITKPQRKFVLTLFAAMLVTGRRINFLNLSRHSSVHEQTYRRQFRKPFDFASFNQSSIASALPETSTQLFAQDASFSAKSGRQTYGLDTFWNGCASKVERGLEVSLISILDVEQHQAFALSAEQTPPPPEIKQHAQSATRIDFYLEHLARTAPYFPAAIKYGVFDGFYAKHKFVHGVCAMGYQVISLLRCDANLLYLYEGVQKPRGRRRQFDGKIKFTDLERFTKIETETPTLTLYTHVVWSVSLPPTNQSRCRGQHQSQGQAALCRVVLDRH